MRDLQRKKGRPAKPAAPLPAVPPPKGRPPARAKPGPLLPSAPAAIRRATQAALIDLLCADALPKNWGERVGLFGAPGTGKTFFESRLIDYLSPRVDVVLVHYAKEEPHKHFRGAVRSTFEAVASDPPTDTNVIIFNDRDLGRIPKPADLAEWSLRQARENNIRSAVVIDEVFYAQSGRQAWTGGQMSPIPEVLRIGRSLGISLVAGTQIPQTMPTELFDLPENTVLFAMEGRVGDYFDYERELLATIAALERGECVVKERGKPWNRTIYGPA